MRILVITNFYPPHFVGGYELGCRDVVDMLRLRGHDVAVLTSTYGLKRPERSGNVYRWLETDGKSAINGSVSYCLRLLKKESINLRAFYRLFNAFHPDVIYIWNPTHISILVALKSQQMGLPVCYFVSDDWLTRWESDALYSLVQHNPRKRRRRVIWKHVVNVLTHSGLVPRGPIELSRVNFASGYLKRAALEAERDCADAGVIHWGIDVNRFTFNEDQRAPRRLLYVGQLTSMKGVGTAVEALKLLVAQQQRLTLTVVGGPDYDNVHRLVSELGLAGHVRFTGLLPREELPAIYKKHDIMLFPSVWEEPFSIAVLEAMSSGLAVVGTNTGGSNEILKNEINALIFPPSDVRACAAQVGRLVQDPELFQTIRRNGRHTVEGTFTLENMVDKIEIALINSNVGAPQRVTAATIGSSPL